MLSVSKSEKFLKYPLSDRKADKQTPEKFVMPLQKFIDLSDVTLNEKLAYLIGFILGDGNVAGRYVNYLIRAVEENEEFMKSFVDKFAKVFHVTPKIYFDKYNNSFVAYIYSKTLWEFFVNKLKIPAGDKSTTVRVSKEIMNSPANVKSAFLSGIFDAEGSVINSKGYAIIQFKVDNNGLAKDVFDMLKSLDLNPKLNNYEYSYEKFSIIRLNGKNQCKLFSEKIGFSHPVKTEKLMKFL